MVASRVEIPLHLGVTHAEEVGAPSGLVLTLRFFARHSNALSNAGRVSSEGECLS